MPFVLGDRVRETSTAPGTGSFTMNGAVQGAQSFASVLTANGDTTWYAASNGTAWETGLLTRTSASVYARTTIFASTNAGAAVNFSSGVVDVFIDLPASIVRTFPATVGGTGQTSYTIGDILYASSASALSKLAGVATGNALISGGVGAAPSWGKIDLTAHITGDLPFANLAQGAALSVLGVTGNATADNASIAAAADHNILRRSGTAVAFGSINLAQSGAVGSSILPAANGGVDTAAWTSYSPTITAGSGSFTTVAATEALYKVIGKTCHLRLKLLLTTIGTAAARTDVTLPFNAASASSGDGINASSHTKMTALVREAAAGSLSFYKYDGTFGWTSGDTVYISATFEIA